MRKKIVLMEESEREAFLRFCEAVENTEIDKDTFLKAARLERHEANPRLTSDQYYWMKLVGIWARVIAVFLIGFFIVCLKGCNI